MATEDVDPRFVDLDAWPLPLAIEAMWDGQMAAVAAVRTALPSIAAATAAAAERLRGKGRIVYVGAGTSGRVAVQDGTELGPTFNWPAERLLYVMAGGDTALLHSIEGAEDDSADGETRMDKAAIEAADVVIGVSASGTTPFTVAALKRARARGALTIGIAGNASSPLLRASEHALLLETGSEVLAGSTRMKAGTAQKVALNLISTGIMIAHGRIYKGLMVDMQTSNAKLKRRAVNIVARLALCDEAKAAEAMGASGGNIKAAVLVALGRTAHDANAALAKAGGNLRKAIG
jgi:N-acetylmuramic acid 6-phosphate etherase